MSVRLFGRGGARTRERGLLAEIAARLGNLERYVARIQRDTEAVRSFAGAVLGPDRAIALLASGDRIYVDPRDRGCGINMLTEGKHEEDDFAVFRRYLKPGATVLDIGANYGIYALASAEQVRPDGRVIGFEPNPHIFNLFGASIILNGVTDVVEARQLAVHDTNGTLRFLIDETGPGGARIVDGAADAGSGAKIIDVPVVRLDDHLGADFVADVVKIDVEGQEEAVLRGMRGIIARSPEIVILVEMFYPFFADDAAFVRYLRFIRDDLGLHIGMVLPHGRLAAAGEDALRGRCGNVLLSKLPIEPMPDLTIWPQAMRLHAGATATGDVVHWQPAAEAQASALLLNGPYVYLPRGSYRLRLDADLHGKFELRVLESFGDPIWSGEAQGDAAFEAIVHLRFDAPHFELAIWSTSESSELTFRRAEMWRM